jgi:two-component system chemotaxis response regulator CheY
MGSIMLSSKRTLIVDDSAVFRKVVIKELVALGLEDSVEASNGRSALAILDNSAEKPFGLLICDIHMPEMGGAELIAVIRADSRFKGLPILVVSSESDKAVIAKAILAGANGYAAKPLTQEGLARALVQMTEKLKTSG